MTPSQTDRCVSHHLRGCRACATRPPRADLTISGDDYLAIMERQRGEALATIERLREEIADRSARDKAATYTITVPKIARYMSANDRPTRWAKAAQTKAWREAAYFAARMRESVWGDIQTFEGIVRITATVHIKDKRRREVSNLFPTFKACIDGFVDAGILADDSDAHVIGPDPRRGYDAVPCIVFELKEVAS